MKVSASGRGWVALHFLRALLWRGPRAPRRQWSIGVVSEHGARALVEDPGTVRAADAPTLVGKRSSEPKELASGQAPTIGFPVRDRGSRAPNIVKSRRATGGWPVPDWLGRAGMPCSAIHLASASLGWNPDPRLSAGRQDGRAQGGLTIQRLAGIDTALSMPSEGDHNG